MKVDSDFRPLDMVNILLGAILGAVLGTSTLFKPTDLSQIIQCLFFIALICGFAMNCHWTVKALRLNHAAFTAIFVLMFVAIEVALITFSISFSHSPNGLSAQFDFAAHGSLWILAITFAALYISNIVGSLYTQWTAS